MDLWAIGEVLGKASVDIRRSATYKGAIARGQLVYGESNEDEEQRNATGRKLSAAMRRL